MRFGAVVHSAPLLVACWASATEPPPIAATEITIRQLTERARVVTDELGGWRLERFSAHGHLIRAEDSFGPLVEVIRVTGGRPVGVILAGRYALEYSYDGAGHAPPSKLLYDPENGTVLAQSRATALAISERRGVSLDMESSQRNGPVIRSLEIDDPVASATLDRVAYTGSHLLLQLGDDPSEMIAVPRLANTGGPGPTVVTVGEPAVARYDVVWSQAGSGRSARVTRPKLKGVLPTAVEDTLLTAFPVALDRVREVPTCRALFEELVVSGNQRLSDTLYAPPSDVRTDDSCDFGALAYTHVDSPITHLCGGFGGLTIDEAAIVLIHEALHFAGLEEAPFYEGALTSTEINQMVYSACGFGSQATVARPSP